MYICCKVIGRKGEKSITKKLRRKTSALCHVQSHWKIYIIKQTESLCSWWNFPHVRVQFKHYLENKCLVSQAEGATRNKIWSTTSQQTNRQPHHHSVPDEPLQVVLCLLLDKQVQETSWHLLLGQQMAQRMGVGVTWQGTSKGAGRCLCGKMEEES